jgi:hypothetical protein
MVCNFAFNALTRLSLFEPASRYAKNNGIFCHKKTRRHRLAGFVNSLRREGR